MAQRAFRLKSRGCLQHETCGDIWLGNVVGGYELLTVAVADYGRRFQPGSLPRAQTRRLHPVELQGEPA